MITMTKTPGNIGNRLFQYASMIGISKANGHGLSFPIISNAFKIQPIHIENIGGIKLKETGFHYAPFDKFLIPDNQTNYDIYGYLQSEKYWVHCKDRVLKALEFKDELKQDIQERYSKELSKPTICISIRRGDFVDNPTYFQIPILFYISALIENFPDWQQRNILIFSDDPEYCQVHFECLPNATIVRDTAINQLCLGSMCDDFIISNSTFSWWMAYLAQRGRVFRPRYNFSDAYRRNHSEKDYWPDGWTAWNPRKLSLKDLTFTIPVQYDHPDRKQNLDLCVCMLQRDLDTKIIVGENNGDSFSNQKKWCKYVKFNYPDFHRTKMLNEMAEMCDTAFVVNYDCDNFIPPLQIYMMAVELRNGADMVYPFDGQSARMPRETWFKSFEKYLDCGIVRDTKFMGKNGGKPRLASVGHAVGFHKQRFFEGGGENENFISFGPEDVERFERFQRLGYKIKRIEGAVYHMDHWCGPDSSRRNKYFVQNHDELKKLRAMTDKELKDHIHSWNWYKPYTASYYESITEEAVRSRDEVFKILGIRETDFVLDVGCGVGQWGINYKGLYSGIDFNIPKEKLLIPESNYFEWDLRKPIEIEVRKADYVLCLEVAEHIEEQYADVLIDNLCALGDTIIFSAAIPYQGGTGHCNEKFQSYWGEKFAERGYRGEVFNEIRNNKSICLWYRQNTIIYRLVHNDKREVDNEVEDFILPEYFEQIVKNMKK